jgi:hypothetical protein
MPEWPDVNQETDRLMYGMSGGGPVEEDDFDTHVHNAFKCATCKDREHCPATREMMEDIYRHMTGISIASFHWRKLWRLSRIIRKLKKMYPSLEAAMEAKNDPRARKLIAQHSAILAVIFEDVTHALAGIEEFYDEHGHYPGMAGAVFADDKDRKREEENSSIYG